MGSRTYDFLSESLLFDESLLADQFSNISENELQKELQKYREFCLSHMTELEQEIQVGSSSFRLFSCNEHLRLDFLARSAFYVQQYVLPDPLFALTYEKGPIHQTYDKFFGMSGRGFDKRAVVATLRYLKKLTPMVAANYVKLLPITYLFEPSDNLPLRHSDNGFADVLPEALLDFFRERAVVWSLKREESGWSMDGGFEVSRGIQVLFGQPDEIEETGSGYFLTEQEILSVDHEKGTFEVCQWLPNDPPDQETFDRWVFQSVNQSAERLYRRVFEENLLAAHFGAAYTTRSQFVFDLLEQTFPTEPGVQTRTANTFLSR